jgi:hypothetical protein
VEKLASTLLALISILIDRQASSVRFGSWLRENVLPVAELGESHLNNAEQVQFDVLFVASSELILRSAASL